MAFDFQLWHAKVPDFKVPACVPDDLNTRYKHLCDFINVKPDETIEAALEEVFLQTQNTSEGAWSEGERSTSVGDLIVLLHPVSEVGVAIYCVAPSGFFTLFE